MVSPLPDAAKRVACPALLIAGCGSGQGKTTVTAALARHHARAGRRVRVFKTGPDFIDPMILAAAAGSPVYNLDCWMIGTEESRARLSEAAAQADLVLVEGAMGLYDGSPSTADLAAAFDLPVAAVLDASAMAETFGALALGLKRYRGIRFAGVIANRVAGPRHASMLARSLPADIPLLATLPRTERSLPERHLGLVQAAEVAELEAMLDELAALIGASGYADLPPPSEFEVLRREPPPRLLAGRTIAVARDVAFSFVYPANLDALAAMGARLVFFSPLGDEPVPQADALYLPGGYPELGAATLARATRWLGSMRSFADAGRPIVAECGGLMPLFERLRGTDGIEYRMAGILPGRVVMHERLAGIGLQTMPTTQGMLRGHTFHYSTLDTPLAAAGVCKPLGTGEGERVYLRGAVHASYFHAYFPSNPAAAAALFACGP